jgi:hypothetical protein
MKPSFLLLAIGISISSLFAQTKKIAHRSHSGSNKTFTTKGESNFGATPEMIRRSDSLRRERLQKDSINKVRIADSLKKANKKQKKTSSNKQ